MSDSTRLRGCGAAALGLALALLGCSESLGPDGSGTGFARALVSDDPSSTTPQAAASAPTFAIAGGSGSGGYTGTISGDVAVAISADGVVWYSLGSPNGTTVQLQASGGGADVHGEVTVPAGTYARVRLILRDAHMRIHAGSQIDGITLTADAQVSLGSGGEIVIEKRVPAFRVRADASVRTEILFDLNSERWMTRDNVESGTADEAEMQDNTTGRTRETPREQPRDSMLQ